MGAAGGGCWWVLLVGAAGGGCNPPLRDVQPGVQPGSSKLGSQCWHVVERRQEVVHMYCTRTAADSPAHPFQHCSATLVLPTPPSAVAPLAAATAACACRSHRPAARQRPVPTIAALPNRRPPTRWAPPPMRWAPLSRRTLPPPRTRWLMPPPPPASPPRSVQGSAVLRVVQGALHTGLCCRQGEMAAGAAAASESAQVSWVRGCVGPLLPYGPCGRECEQRRATSMHAPG